ncbi:MAG: SpoIVB peptidase [Clostridiaceae bacterium]
MKNRKKMKLFYVLTPILLLNILLFNKISQIPSTIYQREGEKLYSNIFVNVCNDEEKKEKTRNVELLGFVPIKTVSTKTIPETYVIPSGEPIGVNIRTKGVLVVGISNLIKDDGEVISPAAVAGIEVGDSILKINNVEITSSELLLKEINRNKSGELKLLILRNGKELNKKVIPVKNLKDNKFKIGLWVRDSISGIGTLTFYDEKSNKFAALGHPITDIDTGQILKISSGEILKASIISVDKGTKGNPGELKGIFASEGILGNIENNSITGINGEMKSKDYRTINKPVKIALRNEIKVGKAKILTTVEGDKPKLFDIEIEKLLPQDEPGAKSMLIKVTDKKLLNTTGGIVQGMSGSPIIQDGKLVGAVTHVLINKPDTGYGIYIEWMLKDSLIIK